MLQSLGANCGKNNPPGTETELFYALDDDFTGFPSRKSDNGGTEYGDSKILDEPFDFTNASAGSGFWRKTTILVDTGEVKDTLEGELGGQGYKSSFGFFLKGTESQNLAFADDIASASGCLIMMLRDRSGNLRVLGKPSNPAMVESAEGTTGAKNGDRRGFAYVASASTGETAPIYDDATHGIDITPN